MSKGSMVVLILLLCTRVPVAADHVDGATFVRSSSTVQPVNSPSLKSSASNTVPVASSSTTTSSKMLASFLQEYREIVPLAMLVSVTAKIWAPSIQTSSCGPYATISTW